MLAAQMGNDSAKVLYIYQQKMKPLSNGASKVSFIQRQSLITSIGLK